ncbi:uncharacterized protein J7T54_006645 [Emericellopsis cladophorae]|uniref:C2H2-type domain-containing protein n=1 Tax=Emericellopsis cladophorae TaxID=2686198 RepID=A0A9P9Y784_9HYPO|nr:uncharacterized protein J7T54_006645 [Emericellopsis cladophorae]KAI6784600.1 hypothetical protein J7T54_006645 [Emericellopsis cladophorae]
MGKKRRGHADIEEILGRPWCYYCERDFEDLKLLISHQKAKHFKCDRCGRRLNTAGGLSVHLNQVHKENLDHVENALPNRQGLEVEIFGMEGIPTEVLESHRNRLIQNFYQAQEDRRIATGNPLPGQAKEPRKKIKIETAEELKTRLREWRARRKEILANGGSLESMMQSAQQQATPAPVPAPAQQQQQYPGQQQAPPQGHFYGQAPEGIPARPPSGPPGVAGLPQRPGGDSIDQLIRKAETGVKPAVEPEKASKKDKKGRMFYDDAEISPEERMAKLPRYAFTAA